MKDKQTKRTQRKALLRQFESTFDLYRLDYKTRTKRGKDEARLVGVGVAAVLYLIVFGLVYFAWSKGTIDGTLMNKVVWIIMIPTSIVGALAWLISVNRKEFPVREDIRAHVTQFEGDSGLLWRYAPALNQLELKKIDIEGLIEASQEGRLIKMAPEDICATIRALHTALQDGDIKPALIDQVEQNLAALKTAA